MRLLLDTHAAVWWFTADHDLPEASRNAIADSDNVVFVSAVAAYEIGYKQGRGMMPAISMSELEFLFRRHQFQFLDISYEHAVTAGALPGPLRDPFDRIIIAQAILEDLTLVSRDEKFAQYRVQTLWKAPARR
jgi:PIN domain nuclease of toxin-antitoxin system